MLRVEARRREGTFLLDVAFTSEHRRVVLFGPSGAGKTMTLRCLAGFLAPDRGKIEVDGAVLFDAARRINVPPWRRRVGVVLQSYTLFPHLTVEANIAYGLPPSWRGREQVWIETLLSAVGLTGYADRRPDQLSGGQQQRVALAQALASEPRLLVLDEPFSAVDAPVRERLRRDLLGLLEAFHVPLVFVTHDFGEAYLLGQTIVILSRGRVVQIGAPAEVAEAPRTATVARLVGATNILRGQIVERERDRIAVRVGGLLLHPLAPGAADQRKRIGDAVTVCVRPEHVRVVAPPGGSAVGTVGRILPRPDGTTVLLHVDGTMMEARVEGGPPPAGSSVGVEIPAGAAHVLDDEDAAVPD